MAYSSYPWNAAVTSLVFNNGISKQLMHIFSEQKSPIMIYENVSVISAALLDGECLQQLYDLWF